MANPGLNVSDIVNVSINLSPIAAQIRNFGSLLIIGDSAVVDPVERMRLYTSMTQVGQDFASNAPEFLAAQAFFGQSPPPVQCYIGRWVSTGNRGSLRGPALSAAQQTLSNFTAVTTGGMNVTVDGTPLVLTGLNFSGAADLFGVAAVLSTALAPAATCTWNSNQRNFIIKSNSAGVGSTVSFGTVGTGTDVTPLLGFQATQGGYISPGIASESILTALTVFDQMSSAWYGLQIAATTAVTNSDYVGLASYIQASANSHILGVTSQEAGALSAFSTIDLPYLLKQGGYTRAFSQYSSSSPYASASIFGRAFTVDFTGQNTTIALMFKQEPGIPPEYLTETQAAALTAKNCNVFVEYNNSTAILQPGVMASGQYFDVIHGTDWLQNDIQTAVYNLLYLAQTKIPQTDSGVTQIVAAVSARCDQALVNGLIAPGIWNGPVLGAIITGQTLIKGYYVYALPIAVQSAADRSARKAPVIQAAIKLAGAIQSANVIVNVNQ